MPAAETYDYRVGVRVDIDDAADVEPLPFRASDLINFKNYRREDEFIIIIHMTSIIYAAQR